MSKRQEMPKPPSLAQLLEAPDGYIGSFGWLCGYTADAGFLNDAVERFVRHTRVQRAHFGRIAVALMLDPSNPQISPIDVPGVAHLPFKQVEYRPFRLLHAKVALLAFCATGDAAEWKMRLIVSTGNWTRATMEENLDLTWHVEVSRADLKINDDAVRQARADITAAWGMLTWLRGLFDTRLLTSIPPGREATHSSDSYHRFEQLMSGIRNARGVAPRFFDSRRGALLSQLPGMVNAQAGHALRNYLGMGSGFFEAPTESNQIPSVLRQVAKTLQGSGLVTQDPIVDVFVNPRGCQAVAQALPAFEAEKWSVREAHKPAYFGAGTDRSLHAKFILSANFRRNSKSCNSAWVYLGSGNLTSPGFTQKMSRGGGNLEVGVVFAPETLYWESARGVPPEQVVTNVLPVQWSSEIETSDAMATGGEFLGADPAYVAPPVACLFWIAEGDEGHLEALDGDDASFDVLDGAGDPCARGDTRGFVWVGGPENNRRRGVKHSFRGWDDVATCLRQEADQQRARAREDARLNDGQCASLRAIASRLPENGVILADAVGMGKTRIAVAVAGCVAKCGGRVAVLVPPGLGYQWEEELRDVGLTDVPPILRSLWAYLAAWQPEDPHQQRPWFANQVVVVSHAFTNWRLGDNPKPWRRALLPEIYALWRKKRSGSLPRYYRDNEVLADPWVRRAGKSIVDALPGARSHPACKFLDRLIDEFKWDGSLNGNYGHGTKLREWLECSVGLGLGVFDLVIVDEAHKSRGDDSGLSRLLANVVLQAREARRLCMTATPVELDVTQWEHTLRRIGVSRDAVNTVRTALSDYSEAARQVRQCWRSGGGTLDKYRAAAEKFQAALTPYVLRRDKGEDRSVKLFQKHSGLSLSRYRSESEISVEVEVLSPRWQQAVCAAEALSFVARMGQDPVAKRLRLTLGNGHGIAALLDQVKLDEEHDKKQLEYDEDRVATEPRVPDDREGDGSATDKRAARAQWWHATILRAFAGEDDSLYDHPAIAAAIAAIEQATAEGEKVLVFGRFTRPMRALTDLLNARAMLRALEQDAPWRQTKVHGERDGASDNSEWPAVRAAHRQLKNELGLGSLDENELDQRLQRQYSRSDSRRERFRNTLCDRLCDGFDRLELGENDKYLKAFEAFARSVAISDDQDLPLVSRALLELSDSADWDSTVKSGSRDLAEAFCDLVRSASERDDPDADEDSDGTIDEDEADSMWVTLRARIREEYSRTQGNFARFMYGGTTPSSRRMIQLAFNRPNSFPKVLVAQSMVGREGLNLHKACRIVVLLHPEWNPGVAE